MNINEIKTAILQGTFDESLLKLYGEAEKSKLRYAAACDSFKDLYPVAGESRLLSAPG